MVLSKSAHSRRLSFFLALIIAQCAYHQSGFGQRLFHELSFDTLKASAPFFQPGVISCSVFNALEGCKGVMSVDCYHKTSKVKFGKGGIPIPFKGEGMVGFVLFSASREMFKEQLYIPLPKRLKKVCEYSISFAFRFETHKARFIYPQIQLRFMDEAPNFDLAFPSKDFDLYYSINTEKNLPEYQQWHRFEAKFRGQEDASCILIGLFSADDRIEPVRINRKKGTQPASYVFVDDFKIWEIRGCTDSSLKEDDILELPTKEKRKLLQSSLQHRNNKADNWSQITAQPVLIKQSIFFPTDSWEIPKQYRERLEKIASKKNVAFAKLYGYADPRGTNKYNYRLSLHRAYAVKSHLVELGVPKNKIEINAIGTQDKSRVPEKTYKFERRVDIEFIIHL